MRRIELCEGKPKRLVLARRFPPGDGREVRQSDREQREGTWLDDLRILDRRQVLPGFSLNVDIGPRRNSQPRLRWAGLGWSGKAHC